MGEPLSTSWIYAEVLDNLNAAQATITVALTYLLWNLAYNSNWQDRIREELTQLPCQDDGFPTFADINAAPIFNACIKESYRLNSLSSGSAERIVPLGKEYNGVLVPPGVRIGCFPITTPNWMQEFKLD
jgi:cytochrome P450